MFVWRWRQRIHPSWLIAASCLGICVGLFAASFLHLAPYSYVWLAVILVLFAIAFKKSRVYVLPLVLCAGILLGIWRGAQYQSQLAPILSLVGRAITVQGKVTDDADTGKNGELVLRVSDVTVSGRRLKGSMWVSLSSKAAIRRGDIVAVKGKVAEGFGSFAASMYRAKLIKAERPIPGDIALRARDWFAGAVRRAVPEPEASLGVGYLVGQRRSLPDELDTALKAAGLTHVVVASGYNLTILVGLSRRLFVKVSKFLAAFFSGGMIIGFIAVTGMSPSMSRAGLVAGLGLAAWYYGRKFHPVVLLSLAAVATLLIQPSYAYGDLGWQLSFASFAGVLIVSPLLQQYFYGADEPGIVRQVLFETLSAWICTVPLIVMVFGQFSNVAILANVLVLPFVPLAMLLTFGAGVVSLAIPAFAIFAGLPATLVLGYMTKLAMYLGNLSWAQTELTITPFVLAVYYAVLIGACGYLWYTTRLNFMEGSAKEQHVNTE